MDLDEHLNDGKRKVKYVQTMFDILAPGYDAFTKVFSFGMDSKWKELLVNEGVRRAPKNPVLVDLACGTGDLGAELAMRTNSPRTIGLDLSKVMLSEAKTRLRDRKNIHLAACDMLHLCLPDKSADMVSVGYGFRNTPDARAALREVARVLKPGGILMNLDFHRPVNGIWRELFLWYMWNFGRIAGWLWHREPITYGYIAPSIRRYWTIPDFERELAAAGFEVEFRASRLNGGIGIHVARLAKLNAG